MSLFNDDAPYLLPFRVLSAYHENLLGEEKTSPLLPKIDSSYP